MLCRDINTAELFAQRNSSSCPTGSSHYRGAGVNMFDALWLYSPAFPAAKRTGRGTLDVVSALQALATSGVRVFRFFATLHGADQVMWMQQPALFWVTFDALLNVVEAHGLVCIPSIGFEWDLVARALGRNETANDLVRNATSLSRTLARRRGLPVTPTTRTYNHRTKGGTHKIPNNNTRTAHHTPRSFFHDVTARYHSRKSILFWELGNELNLRANLPPPRCGTHRCFSTAELVSFSAELVSGAYLCACVAAVWGHSLSQSGGRDRIDPYTQPQPIFSVSHPATSLPYPFHHPTPPPPYFHPTPPSTIPILCTLLIIPSTHPTSVFYPGRSGIQVHSAELSGLYIHTYMPR